MSAAQKRQTPLAGGAVANQSTLETAPIITLTTVKSEPRIDSRLLAVSMGKGHKPTMELVNRYAQALRGFGHLPFQTEVGAREQGGGNPERYALLNEDQAFFLLTLTRNTARTVELKAKLVKAFGEARRAAEAGVEYLPTYHALHDELHALAAGSPNERFAHMNVNKLVNQAAGIGAGERGTLPAAPKAMLIVAQDVAAKAMRGAGDHHDGYQRAKAALLALSAATMLEVAHG